MKAIKRTKEFEYVAVRMSVRQAEVLKEILDMCLDDDKITPPYGYADKKLEGRERTEVVTDLAGELEQVLA